MDSKTGQPGEKKSKYMKMNGSQAVDCGGGRGECGHLVVSIISAVTPTENREMSLTGHSPPPGVPPTT